VSNPTVRRLAIATSKAIPGIHPDDVELADALRELGVAPTPCVWSDTSVDWARFDAVLIRTIWDYPAHYPAFLAWLDFLDLFQIPVINDSALVRWNSDKHYLDDLAGQSVDVIPTRMARVEELPELLQAMPGRDVVVKPTVSGSARRTIRGTVGEAAFEGAVASLPTGFHYMVQPFLPEIIDEGEWSLLYFDGCFSHAVLKKPAFGDYRVQADFGGTAQPVLPEPSLRGAAERALEAVAAMGLPGPVYARVDGVVSGGRFLLMELEMIEPFLHLEGRPYAARCLASAVAERVRGTVVGRSNPGRAGVGRRAL
jgi:glutathione synthase/RimK-type ligase-like ATP-grasp enzyme